MLTRLGKAGAEAFTIMRIAAHGTVTVSQRYVHATPEGLGQAFVGGSMVAININVRALSSAVRAADS